MQLFETSHQIDMPVVDSIVILLRQQFKFDNSDEPSEESDELDWN